MKDQTEKESPDRIRDIHADEAGRRGGDESPDHGKHGGIQCETMMEQILSPENLRLAWHKVRANKGAPGVDGMNVEGFVEFFRKHGARICSDLKKGNYRPAPVRRVFIPKPDGTQRPLGVPTVLDRVIQQAVAQIINPLFEPEFSEHSYGFRENRNAHQAVRQVEACWRRRLRYAVDCDLKSFFDTVNHDRLMEALRRKIRDGKVLGLIRRYLKAGVILPEGTREETPMGVPQGGPLSPLLANIILDPLDKELEKRGHEFARYADDFLVMVKSQKAAQRVMRSLSLYIEGKLKLVVNRLKSKTAPLSQCTFLGFQIGAKGRVVWTDKAMKRFKQRVKEITSRNRGHNVKDVIDELKRYVDGWMNYFGISHSYREVLELEEWIRRRVRLYYWKSWKQPRTRRRHLIALGISPEKVRMASRSRKGFWRMSANSLVQIAMNNAWLRKQGVPQLRETWITIHYGKSENAPA